MESEFPLIYHIFAYTARQGWLVIWYCLGLLEQAGNNLAAVIRVELVLLGRCNSDGKAGATRGRKESPCLSFRRTEKEYSYNTSVICLSAINTRE